jgi:hypothetical protein
MYEPQVKDQKDRLSRLPMVISDCRDIRALLQKEGLSGPRDHGYGSLCCHLMSCFPYFLSRVDISGAYMSLYLWRNKHFRRPPSKQRERICSSRQG